MPPPGSTRRAAFALLSGALVAVTAVGCVMNQATVARPASSPSPWVSPTTSPTTSPTVDSPSPSATATRAATASRGGGGGGGGGAAGPNRLPVVHSLTASPRDITPPPCGRSARPSVTARVTDADHAPGSLRVRLTYHFSSRYQGEVRMGYNSAARAFTHTLPVFDRVHDPGGEGGHIVFSVIVTDPTGQGPRPYSGAFIIVNACLGTIANG